MGSFNIQSWYKLSIHKNLVFINLSLVFDSFYFLSKKTILTFCKGNEALYSLVMIKILRWNSCTSDKKIKTLRKIWDLCYCILCIVRCNVPIFRFWIWRELEWIKAILFIFCPGLLYALNGAPKRKIRQCKKRNGCK